MATVQEVAAGVSEAGLYITAAGTASAQPEVAAVGVAVFAASWLVGRAASALGTASTTYQYNDNLNNTNGTDMYMSWGTTIAGLNPAWSTTTSTVNLLYTAGRTTGAQVADVPWLFPRKE